MNGSGPLVAWGGLINISVKVSKLIIFCLFFFGLVFEVGWIIWLRLTSDSRCSKMVLCAWPSRLYCPHAEVIGVCPHTGFSNDSLHRSTAFSHKSSSQQWDNGFGLSGSSHWLLP